jgi:hypothetical protein
MSTDYKQGCRTPVLELEDGSLSRRVDARRLGDHFLHEPLKQREQVGRSF